VVDQAFYNPALILVAGCPLFVAGLAIVHFHNQWADVCFGRAQTILLQRERIKQATIRDRRLQHQKQAA